jgi:hypothetical protein
MHPVTHAALAGEGDPPADFSALVTALRLSLPQ